MRASRRKSVPKGRWPAPTPDGAGELQTSSGRIAIELEWDRSTESLGRIRGKAASYVEYYSHFWDSERHHVLFVLPTHDREVDAREMIWHERPRYSHLKCCRFWTSTHSRVRGYPLERIWLPVDVRSQKEPDLDILARLRTAITAMKPQGENERPFRDCIGKERWWDRRPGGGQAA